MLYDVYITHAFPFSLSLHGTLELLYVEVERDDELGEIAVELSDRRHQLFLLLEQLLDLFYDRRDLCLCLGDGVLRRFDDFVQLDDLRLARRLRRWRLLLWFLFFFLDGRRNRGNGRLLLLLLLLLRFFFHLFGFFVFEAGATVAMTRRVLARVLGYLLTFVLFLLCGHGFVSSVGMISWSGCFRCAYAVRARVFAFDKRKMNV